jgi:hypothetical protein
VTAVFVGIGITSAQQLAEEVPFDLLMLVLLAEQCRRVLQMSKVIFLIADSTAKYNSFATELDVIKRSRCLSKILRNASLLLNANQYFVIAAVSELHLDDLARLRAPVTAALARQVELSDAVMRYTAEQIALMEYLRIKANAVLKISWVVRDRSSSLGFGDQFFDGIYRDLFPGRYSFVNTVPGRTFDRNRRRACPYVGWSNQSRIFIDTKENVEHKIAAYLSPRSRTCAEMMNHLMHIVDLYESLVAPIPALTLAAKVQYLVDQLAWTSE